MPRFSVLNMVPVCSDTTIHRRYLNTTGRTVIKILTLKSILIIENADDCDTPIINRQRIETNTGSKQIQDRNRHRIKADAGSKQTQD